MTGNLPGTTLPLPEGQQDALFTVLDPIFAVSPGGLLLSQVTELTGLGAATIQNWVKRGWVSNPVSKRYGELHVARILLINLLRPAMKLESIAALLRYVNGSVDDRTDDIIPETQLHSRLYSVLTRLEPQDSIITHESIITLIGAQLEGYEGPVADAKERLENAMRIMVLNIAASRLMQQADALFSHLTDTGMA